MALGWCVPTPWPALSNGGPLPPLHSLGASKWLLVELLFWFTSQRYMAQTRSWETPTSPPDSGDGLGHLLELLRGIPPQSVQAPRMVSLPPSAGGPHLVGGRGERLLRGQLERNTVRRRVQIHRARGGAWEAQGLAPETPEPTGPLHRLRLSCLRGRPGQVGCQALGRRSHSQWAASLPLPCTTPKIREHCP